MTGAQRADQLRMIFNDRVAELCAASQPLSIEQAEAAVFRAAEEIEEMLPESGRRYEQLDTSGAGA